MTIEQTPPPAAAKPEDGGPILRLALDLGPLIVFLGTNWLTGNIFLATGIFMAATAVAMLVSRLTAGRISPILWFSGVMVFVLGGLTVWLHNETFIKIKPTIYYVMISAILLFGMWTNRPMLKMVLGHAYPGLTDRGWAILTRNWVAFFLVLAAANELVWRTTSTDFWLGYKLWGALPATMLFAIANIPMLMRHGMAQDTTVAEEVTALPPQP